MRLKYWKPTATFMFYAMQCPGSSNILLDTKLFLCALPMLWEACLILTVSVKASSWCLILISTVFTPFQHCTAQAHAERHSSILPKYIVGDSCYKWTFSSECIWHSHNGLGGKETFKFARGTRGQHPLISLPSSAAAIWRKSISSLCSAKLRDDRYKRTPPCVLLASA